jgi:hypothetical protein
MPCLQDTRFRYLPVRRVVDLRRVMGSFEPTLQKRSLAPIRSRHRGLPATATAYLALWDSGGRKRREEDKCATYIPDRLCTRGVTRRVLDRWRIRWGKTCGQPNCEGEILYGHDR